MFALMVLASGCHRARLRVLETSDSRAKLAIIGDVNAATGKKTPTVWQIPPGAFEIAVGTVADRADASRAGTGVILGGTGFLRPGARDLAANSELLITTTPHATFLAGLPPDQHGGVRYEIDEYHPVEIGEAAREMLLRQDAKALFVVGQCRFADFAGTSWAAARDSAPNDAATQSVPVPEAVRLRNVPVLFAGVVVSGETSLDATTSRLFNGDKNGIPGSPPRLRLHGLVLGTEQEVSWRNAESVRVNAIQCAEIEPRSRIARGEIEVFVIKDFDAKK